MGCAEMIEVHDALKRAAIRGFICDTALTLEGHRQLERAVSAPAASVRSPSCQKAAILETLRQVAKARSREARRKSAVAVSG